jgi:hypothetical protein
MWKETTSFSPKTFSQFRIHNRHRCLYLTGLHLKRRFAKEGTRLLRLYRIPTIHKEGVPWRPVVSNIGVPNYKLSQYLAGLLSPLVGYSSHLVTNSIEFVHTLGSLQARSENLMVSCDVVSLFTWVTIVELLNLLSQQFSGEILVLFTYVLTPTYFSVGGQFYEQRDGVAMSSPSLLSSLTFLWKTLRSGP